jgi:hypothetical protein
VNVAPRLRTLGAFGRSYLDKTKKLVDVDIRRGFGTNETTLFSHRYKFVGSDLGSDLDVNIHWNSQEEVVVSVYDYGPGVSGYDVPKTGAPSNYIATLAFRDDANEPARPESLIRQIHATWWAINSTFPCAADGRYSSFARSWCDW